jgi:hypothetical protein
MLIDHAFPSVLHSDDAVQVHHIAVQGYAEIPKSTCYGG